MRAMPYNPGTPRKQSLGRLFFFLRLFLILIIFSGVIGGTGYVVLFSHWVRISSLEVQGAHILHAEDIISVARQRMSERAKGIFPRNSFLLFPQAALSEAILHDFPRIASLAIERPALTKVILHIQERDILGIWCPEHNSVCAFFDSAGVIFDEAPSATQGNLFWVVQDARAAEIPAFGTAVFDDKFLTFLQKLRSALEAPDFPKSGAIGGKSQSFRASPLREDLLQYRIEANGSEVHVRVLEGGHTWQIYFSSSDDAAYQVRVLERVLEEEIGKDKRPYLQYIDLRVKNKVFYKLQ